MRLKNRELWFLERRCRPNGTSMIGKHEGTYVWMPFHSFRIDKNVYRNYLAPTSTKTPKDWDNKNNLTHVIDCVVDDNLKIQSWIVRPITQEDRDNFYKTDYEPPIDTYQN